jgi:predicted PurR-regulated permease PerM
VPDDPYGQPNPPISRRSPFVRGFLGALGVLTALVLALAVRDASSVLVLVLISAVLAVSLDPLVGFAVRRGVKRGWAVLGIAIVFLILITAIVFVIGGAVRAQVTRLIDDAPHLLDELRQNRSIAKLDAKYHVISSLENKLKNPDFAKSNLKTFFDVGLSVLNALANIIVVFVLTLYFLSALPQLKEAGYSLAPAARRDRVRKLGDEILRRVGGYVIGAVFVATIAGTLTFVFLLCVGLSQYALPLALLVGLLDLVPLVGAILGAAIVSLVGLATSLPVGIACILFYVIYELIEGYVLYPRVMRSSVDVPEYVTIVAVLLGGAVGGIVGALLALPTAAAVLLLVRETWVRRQAD